jgi:hypothetical protein
LDSHFNDDNADVTRPHAAAGATGVSDEAAPAPAGVPDPAQGPGEPLVPAAVIKFRSCRWRRPPEDGVECCGHRDVLPIAGTTSFDPAAWCPDCTFFKLRRMPKKRSYY